MITISFPERNHLGEQLRRSPIRSVAYYQFYLKNYPNIIKNENPVDIKIYNKMKESCLCDKISAKRICACLYDDKGKIVSEGVNSFNKTHPLQEKFGNTRHKIFLHAEIDTVVRGLRKVNSDSLEGLNLAIARVCCDGTDAQAFPCDGCIEALKFYGCSSITYYDDILGIAKLKL